MLNLLISPGKASQQRQSDEGKKHPFHGTRAEAVAAGRADFITGRTYSNADMIEWMKSWAATK